MIFLSIIIPAYNSEETIVSLLSSIAKSKKVNFKEIEIIIVDDKSTDYTVKAIINHIVSSTSHSGEPRFNRGDSRIIRGSWTSQDDSCRIITLKRNSGPAKARNIGAKRARGKVLLFLDADVEVYKDTLFEILRSFKSDPDLYALTGVWDKEQRSNRFFPKFKALRDWSYWINERDPKNYYYLFSTRIAAIDKGLFERLGGFDTTYKAALVEDMELTYRIARRFAVVFNPKVIVHHEFEDFWPIAKKYFWRSYYWSKIYRERKKFDPVATTWKEALTTISAAGLVGSVLLLGVIRGIREIRGVRGLEQAEILLFATFFLLFLIHFWGVRKFLWFVAREEGIVFAIKSFFTGIILYLVILAGAGASVLRIDNRG